MATQDRLPTGDGVRVEFTANTGLEWDAVNDPIGSPDEDTTYLYVTSSIREQEYTFLAFAITSSSIEKVSVTARGKFSGTAVNIGSQLLVNSLRYYSAQTALTTSYADYAWDWLTNPNTSAAWVEADVEGTGASPLTSFGTRAYNISAGEELDCTQSYITVTYTEAGGGDPEGSLVGGKLIKGGLLKHGVLVGRG